MEETIIKTMENPMSRKLSESTSSIKKLSISEIRCNKCNDKKPEYCPCRIVDDYYPTFGMGSIILDETILQLECKPIVSFFPSRDVTKASYLLHNASKVDVINLEKDVDKPSYYVFSAFFENIECIDKSDYVYFPIKRNSKPEQKITVTCKTNPKTGIRQVTRTDDPNGSPYTYVPTVEPTVIMDPFTSAIICDTDNSWAGSKDSDYRIAYGIIEEIEAEVNTVHIQSLRKKAIREANEVIKRVKIQKNLPKVVAE